MNFAINGIIKAKGEVIMNEGKVVKKKKKRIINKIITLLLLVTILIFFGIIFYINVIPVLYTIGALLIVLLITGGLTLLNLSKKKGCRIIGYFFSILITFILIFIQIYLFNTLGFLFNITNGDYAINTYNLVVLKNSQFDDIKDLKNETIGISDTSLSDSFEEAQEKISDKVQVKYNNYEDTNSLVDGIIDEEVSGILIENSELELLKEQDVTKYDLLDSIYKIEIKNDIKTLKDAVNINREPFNVYISGIDTYGNINANSRSDVNMVMTVNPKEEKILITWIPRDYYVNINNSTYKDKLTHAGIYGIDSSIYAVEKLFDIDINYYVKVNFTSVISVVDLLDGITVNNDEAFRSSTGIYFKKGKITLNGEETLTYVRERKTVSGGDLGRGKHQIMVLEAIMNKAMSPSIIKNYNSLLNSLEGAFVTNMSHTTMLGFIKKELQSPRNWQMESSTLTGTDSLEYTYSYKKTQLYVMKPDQNIVTEAKEKIANLMVN